MYSLTADQKKAIVEALKEAGRILLLGALAAAGSAITYLTGLITDPMWLVIAGSVSTVVLKAIDKFVHKLSSTPATGITGF